MLAQQGWIPIGVTKSGYFVHENRSDECFFRKATGVEENNNNYIFENFCDNKFELKFSEMLNSAREFMYHKDDMLSGFDEVWMTSNIGKLRELLFKYIIEGISYKI